MMVLLVRKKSYSKSVARIRWSLEEWLTLIIIDDTMTAETDILNSAPSVKHLLQHPLARRVLLNELISLRKSISGSAAENLKAVYRQLNLMEESLTDLRDLRWHKKVAGIQQLSIMDMTGYTDKIYRLTNHSNEFVRMESQLALVQLHGYKGLRFLSIIRHPLSDWQQLSLLHLLSNKVMDDLAPVSKWLQSQESTIICFTLKLITMVQEHRFEHEVRNCLQRAEENILTQTIKCIDELGIEMDEATVEGVYQRGTRSVQLEIVRYVLKNYADQWTSLYRHFQGNTNPEVGLLLERADQSDRSLNIAV
jgi:hypothetical protein